MSRSTSRIGLTAPNAFWWQCPCNRICASRGAKGGFEAPCPCLTRDELFKHQRLPGHDVSPLAQTHDQHLVTQREQAGRLEADDRDARPGKRQQRLDQSPRLLPGLLNHTAAEKSPTTAVMAALPGQRM